MIIKNDEEALRKPCVDVGADEAAGLISMLEKELDYSARLGEPGIGLAAPQCGFLKKAAIIRVGEVKINLINAEIDLNKCYNLSKFTNEGCLSFPNKLEDTMRYQEIVVKNNLVYPHSFIAVGLIAVVCQHEIGHYNNDLFFDHKYKIDKKIGPNDPCPCGKINPFTKRANKYKKCCGI